MDVTFPVMVPIGSWRVHPHVFFELLAYAVAAGLFLWLRRRRGDVAWACGSRPETCTYFR